MGCWNGTCALTQLPIYCEEPVLAFIVRKNPGRDDLCGGGYTYPEDNFVPMSPAIIGFYDDYGSVDGIEEETYLLEDLRRRFQSGELELKVKRRAHLFPNGAQPIETYSLKELIDFIERGIVVAKDENGEYPVSLILVIKSVYDALNTRQWFGELRTGVEAWLEEAIENHLEHAKLLQEEGLFAFSFTHPNLFLCRYLNPLWNLYLQNENAELYEALITVNLLNQLFLMYRKSWTPQTGAGSQDGHEHYDDLLDEMQLYIASHTEEEGE